MTSDRTLTPLFKVATVICFILLFGVILNSISTRKDKIIAERDHQTLVRISLVREEYERQMADMKTICEQKVQQVMNLMKKSATEELEKQRKQLEEMYAKELRHQSDDIENLKFELKKISENKESMPANSAEPSSSMEHIKQLLSKITSRILLQEKELNRDNIAEDISSEESEKIGRKDDAATEEVSNQLDRRKT